MSQAEQADRAHPTDAAPGDSRGSEDGGSHGIGIYLAGLGLAVLLTGTSFLIASTDLVWAPSIPVALCVLAIAQMGVHLVFFLHITTGSDNINNIMALAFGVLICVLLISGSLFIMGHLDHMMPTDQARQMQMQN